MTTKVIMAGEAGDPVGGRWEGTSLAGPYDVPGRGPCHTICWHTWTGPEPVTPWSDIRSADSIRFIEGN